VRESRGDTAVPVTFDWLERGILILMMACTGRRRGFSDRELPDAPEHEPMSALQVDQYCKEILDPKRRTLYAELLGLNEAKLESAAEEVKTLLRERRQTWERAERGRRESQGDE
jgi:hypothetical protein